MPCDCGCGGQETSAIQPRTCVEPLLGATLAKRRLGLGKSLRDDPRSAVNVIERHDHVIEPDGQGRHAELVGPRRRHSFQTAAKIVAEQAGGPALKRRQVRAAQLSQRIAATALPASRRASLPSAGTRTKSNGSAARKEYRPSVGCGIALSRNRQCGRRAIRKNTSSGCGAGRSSSTSGKSRLCPRSKSAFTSGGDSLGRRRRAGHSSEGYSSTMTGGGAG